jgi:hypothetical protein
MALHPPDAATAAALAGLLHAAMAQHNTADAQVSVQAAVYYW